MFVEHRFSPQAQTTDFIRSLVPKFGYDGFGEVIFYRTYSRTCCKDCRCHLIGPDDHCPICGEIGNYGQETWNDVVLRVTTGTYSIRKDYYLKNRIPWDETFWQGHAYGFAKTMFDMKWLPPGRGLWAMGSNFVYERGAMALYNCAYTNLTEGEEFADDIVWLMDSLMHGVGVGFGPLRDGLCLRPTTNELPYLFVIPDSREGWVEAVRARLLSYIRGSRPVEFDAHLVRIKGLPIRGFGGISSGPEPLMLLLEQLKEQCELFISGGIDVVEFKTNVANLVGCCVVAGNVRRSAEIACGSIHDETFMNLKNYVKNPHREGYGWMSNNSVILDEVEDFDKLGWIAERVIHNGEPGVINRRNLRYGRIGKRGYVRPDKAEGFNPCQPGWAKVLTFNGIRNLKEVVVGDQIWSETGWTFIVAKSSSGVKKVYKYTTRASIFYGTENHRVVSDFFKVPVKDASTIDTLAGPRAENEGYNLQAVTDGLVLGDGTNHHGIVLLNIGDKDGDVLKELENYIDSVTYNKTYQYKVLTTIQEKELPRTFEHSVPVRYIHADRYTVASFLRGLYSANGSVCGNRVSLKATSKTLIEDVQLMLSSLGVRSYYTTNKAKDVKFENGTYRCKQSYDLQISQDRELFFANIGFIQEYKTVALFNLIQKLEKTKEYKRTYEIVEIEYISEEEVFDITVDNHTHTYWTQGCNVSNCGEIPLEHREVCNLSETLPTVCTGPDDWYKSCEYATFYSSTVSLLPTHQPSTNRVVARNRRIGVGIIDFSGWKHTNGVHQVTKWLRNGYDVVSETNRQLNAEAGVPEALRKTTVKPGGTTPKLVGRTSGCGHPTFHYTLRRLRVAQNAPVHQLFVDANIPYEKDVYSANTDCFEYPILQGPAKPAEFVSLWEQAMNIVLLQREWSDNAVSNTLYFKPMWQLVEVYSGTGSNVALAKRIGINTLTTLLERKQQVYIVPETVKVTYKLHEGKIVEAKVYEFDPSHEENDIEPVLSSIIPHCKSISLLPHTAQGVYRQSPEEGISKEEYELRKSHIKPIDWSKFSGSDGLDERYCQGDVCERGSV